MVGGLPRDAAPGWRPARGFPVGRWVGEGRAGRRAAPGPLAS